jgi:hypothetical protein
LLPALGLVLLLTAWLPARASGQSTRCVHPDGAGGCYTTIQAAVDAALPGDAVVVAPGVYTESVVIAKSLTLQGGWKPTGSLTRTVIHSPGGCALDLTGVAGRISHLTLLGGAPAALCGLMVAELTLEALDISGAEDGISLLVAGPVTQTSLLVHDNARDGLSFLCLGGAGEVVRGSQSRFLANGRYGVSGGENCDSEFRTVTVRGNGAAGFYGFGGQCPVGQARLFDTQLLIARSTVANNGVGIHKLCGGLLLVEQSWISDQLTGTLIEGGAAFQSSNSIYVNNTGAAWFLNGATQATSDSDTFADNEQLTLALWPDALNCFQAPEVVVRNGIIWSSAHPLGAPAGNPCPDDPAYRVALSHTLLVSATLYDTDPDVVLGAGILEADPRFADATYRLAPDSPAIDSAGPQFPAEDRVGESRPQDGNGDGVAVADRGAYELPNPGYFYFFPVVGSSSAK